MVKKENSGTEEEDCVILVVVQSVKEFRHGDFSQNLTSSRVL